MEAVRIAFLVCHLASLATLLGAFLAQITAGRDLRKVLVGAAAVLLATGGALVVANLAANLALNGPKVGVKLAVAVTVLGCAVFAARRRDRALVYATGLLTVANIAVAVAWV